MGYIIDQRVKNSIKLASKLVYVGCHETRISPRLKIIFYLMWWSNKLVKRGETKRRGTKGCVFTASQTSTNSFIREFHSEKGTFAKFHREIYAVEAEIGRIQKQNLVSNQHGGNTREEGGYGRKMNRVKG